MINKKLTQVCGEIIELHHDKKISILNCELAVDKMGSPVILLQDWSVDEKSRHLVTLHLKDAIRLKAVFDSLILDATLHENPYINKLMGYEDEK